MIPSCLIFLVGIINGYMIDYSKEEIEKLEI